MEHVVKITEFIFNSFVHIWPYLLISIPLAVLVQFSGAAKFINKTFSRNPIVAILLATIVGAFSPFCSCGVIPIIASLLLGGVPIAPVMAFWIASPSMDPEIFFLSVATVGWKMSIWRLASTFIISLSSGYITHFAYTRGFLGEDVLRKNQASTVNTSWKSIAYKVIDMFKVVLGTNKSTAIVSLKLAGANEKSNYHNVSCCLSVNDLTLKSETTQEIKEESCNCGEASEPIKPSFHKRLSLEIWKATIMVLKFMALAFFINALISLYVPKEAISSLLGGKGSFSVIIASLVGIPAYTSNLTALPLICGLLSLGMNEGAALAFLIAGPTTTLPAMIAVWGITKRKVFLLYISFSMIGAILFGLLYNLFA